MPAEFLAGSTEDRSNRSLLMADDVLQISGSSLDCQDKLPSYVRRSSVPSFRWTASCVMQATSNPGLAYSKPTAAPFSRHAARRKLPLIICAALRFETSSRPWRRDLPKIRGGTARQGVFRSVVDLQVAINRFVAETNADPKPFVWTADPKRVLAAVKRGKQTLESIH
jgi:hypothetical protein